MTKNIKLLTNEKVIFLKYFNINEAVAINAFILTSSKK
jgi:hypothetical protein